MTVDVIATKLAGHRLNYVRTLLENCADPSRFRVLTSSGQRQPQMDELERALDATGAGLRTVELAPDDASAWASLISASRNPTLAMELDDLIVPLSRLGRRGAVTGLIMRPWGMGGASPRLRASQVVKRTLVAQMLRRKQLTAVALLRQASITFWGTRPPVYEVPDPIRLPNDVPRKVVERSEAFAEVAIVGGIDRRKNPQLVLDAVAKANASSGSKWRLRLYGVLTPDVEEAVSRHVHCELVDIDHAWLTDDELWRRIADADVIACVHDNPGPSGIVGLSVGVGTPVVVLDKGDPARFIRASRAGIVAPRPTTDAVARALVAAHQQQSKLRSAARREVESLRLSPQRFAQGLSNMVSR